MINQITAAYDRYVQTGTIINETLVTEMKVCTTWQFCVRLDSCSCEVKFVQERGVVRLLDVAKFDFLLPRN